MPTRNSCGFHGWPLTWLTLLLLMLTAVSRAAQLGATFDGTNGVDFHVFSSTASRIEVWIYANPQGEAEKLRVPLTVDPATHIWSVNIPANMLPASPGAVLYGYRAWGPNWPFVATWTKGSADGFIADCDKDGNRFNPNKLLLDPYAREVTHDYLTPAHSDGTIYLSGSVSRLIDTGDLAPKGVLTPPDTTDFGKKPARTLIDDVIYEVHLRGLTKSDPSIAAALQGTYAGAAQEAVALKSLGITAVEFLPVFELQNDTNGSVQGSPANDNYWGYDPNSFFAPDRRYASDKSWGGPTKEFKAMVRAFHDSGIKVILDVVYNHTGEGNVDTDSATVGAIRSWRGLDNRSYYELRDDNATYTSNGQPTQWRQNAYYANNNGVGPNYNAANSTARDLVIDSLRHWSDDMGVDGFRFDLAAVLGNSQSHGDFTFDAGDPNNILNRAAKELPARKPNGEGVELIAEPYAIGSNAFQLGHFPAGWSEWNDRFRYPIRKAQNKLGIAGNEVTPDDLITLFAGSSDLFSSNGRQPFHGINYVTAHDGFTLRDLYSFNDKQNNLPFPLGPSNGGSDTNFSWDQGGDPAKQRQASRTGLALLMVSAGVPMIVGGDEMYRTEFGNNNPFNLDNSSFYLNYALPNQFPHFLAFSKSIIAFRHAHPAFQRSTFFDGKDHNGNGLKDITWIRDNGVEAEQDYLGNSANHFIAFRLDGTESGDSATSIYVAYNGWKDDIVATLPGNLPGNHWNLAADTDGNLESNDNSFNPPKPYNGQTYRVAARSVVILIEKP
jgi:isoamylase